MAYDVLMYVTESNIQWKESLDGKGINDANPHAHEHHYYDFLCCAMYGLEFIVNDLFTSKSSTSIFCKRAL